MPIFRKRDMGREAGFGLKVLLSLILYLIGTLAASAERIAGISRSQADSLGRETVIYDGLPVTFNTLSRDLLKKVYGKTDYRGLSAEQVIASIRLYPVEWRNEPLIYVKDEALGERLGARNKYLSLSSLFEPDGTYSLTSMYGRGDKKEERALTELDEKVGIILSIISGDLIVKDDHKRLPEWRVEIELFYNRLPLKMLIFIFLFCGGLSSIGSGVYEKVAEKEIPSAFKAGFGCFLPLSFGVAVCNFILEWVLAGRVPLSNTGETLSFTVMLALAVMQTGCVRGKTVYGISMLFWGCVALVCYLIGQNPVVTPLMPALQSPWLSIHVTLIMAAYSLFGLTFVIAWVGIFDPDRYDRLGRETQWFLIPGILLLAAGIVTGSIWAKEAWGAYWSWDPKETWALVTLIIYLLPLILKIKGRGFYILLIIAFLSVVMTYFGVNYLIGGRHSYV